MKPAVGPVNESKSALPVQQRQAYSGEHNDEQDAEESVSAADKGADQSDCHRLQREGDRRKAQVKLNGAEEDEQSRKHSDEYDSAKRS